MFEQMPGLGGFQNQDQQQRRLQSPLRPANSMQATQQPNQQNRPPQQFRPQQMQQNRPPMPMQQLQLQPQQRPMMPMQQNQMQLQPPMQQNTMAPVSMEQPQFNPPPPMINPNGLDYRQVALQNMMRQTDRSRNF